MSCTNESTPPPLPCNGGVIEVRIVAPDSALGLSAEAICAARRSLVRASASSKQTRTVSMAVPPGPYLLRASALGGISYYYSAEGPVDHSTEADTIWIGPDCPRFAAEFRLGAVVLRATTPGALEGVEIDAVLAPAAASSGYPNVRINARCRDGEVVMRLPAVRAGEYRATIYPAGTESFAPTVPVAQELIVEAGRATVAMLDLPAPAYIEGVVRGSWQQMRYLSTSLTPDVTLYRPDSTQMLRVSPRADGSWSSPLFDLSPTRVAVEVGGLTRWIGGTGFREATPFQPVAGETLAIPEEVESGLVLRLAGPPGEFQFDARLELSDSSGRPLAGYSPNTSGVAGGNRIAVCNLVPGTLYLRVLRRDLAGSGLWSGAWYEHAGDREQATPVTIRERGEVLVLEMHLPAAAVIRARPRPPEPVPHQTVSVRLFSAADTMRTLEVQSAAAADGSFDFRGMMPSRYLLQAMVYRDDSWIRSWYPGSRYASGAREVEIRDFGEVREAEWELPR